MFSWLTKKLPQRARHWPRLWLWVLLAGCSSAPAQRDFYEVAPGVEYLDAPIDGSARAHVFRVDLTRWSLFSVLARGASRDVATVEALAQETSAPLMINGGFFDEELAPMGLIITGGKQLSPLRKADWGVFYVRDQRPALKHTSEIKDVSGFSFAVQCGPRVLISGEVPKLKAQSFARTAIGVTRDERVLLLVTHQGPVAADVLGQFFKEKLSATDALLLDGGPSTQLYAKLGGLTLSRPGGTGIAHGIGLTPQKEAP